jgi:hypothetical protein
MIERFMKRFINGDPSVPYKPGPALGFHLTKGDKPSFEWTTFVEGERSRCPPVYLAEYHCRSIQVGRFCCRSEILNVFRD